MQLASTPPTSPTDHPNRRSEQGFTLLELLLAIAIFAILGLAANTSLQQVLRADAQSREHTEQLAELQWAINQLQQDFEHLVAYRPHRSEEEASQPWSLRGADGEAFSEQDGVTLLRGGWRNPADMLPRSELQLVQYRLSEQQLLRGYYPYPDVVLGSELIERPLLDGVEALALSYFDGTEWQESWQSLQSPHAVRVRLTLAQWGDIERLFLLGGGQL